MDFLLTSFWPRNSPENFLALFFRNEKKRAPENQFNVLEAIERRFPVRQWVMHWPLYASAGFSQLREIALDDAACLAIVWCSAAKSWPKSYRVDQHSGFIWRPNFGRIDARHSEKRRFRNLILSLIRLSGARHESGRLQASANSIS